MKKIVYLILLAFLFEKGYSQTINYSFTAAAGTYAANTGATQIVSPGSDSGVSSSTGIGFTFQFGCQNYTTFQATANGVMFLGTTGAGANTANNLTGGSDRPIIAPLWDDLATTNNANGGQVNYVVTGTSPNRVLTVEWKNMKWDYSVGNANYAISFQVKLYETSNRIEFVYNRNGGAVVNGSASIGLGGVNAGDFYSLDGVGTAPNASKAVETTTLNSKPATGQIYRWDPVVCSGAPTAGTAVATPSAACGAFNTTLTLSGNSTSCGLTYQWYYSNAAAGTYTAIGSATTASTQTFVVTSTTYFKAVVTCGASSATTAVITASVNPLVGTGNYSITVPYSSGAQTTCGKVNDVTSGNVATICGSSSYFGGEDVLYVFTPTVTSTFTANVTSSGSYMGVMLYQGCPTANGACITYTQSSAGNQTLSASGGSCGSAAITVSAGVTYYLMLDSYPTPTCNPYSLTISTASVAGASTVAPCNFNYSAASTTFSFETFTGTSLPLTDDVLFTDYIDFGFPFCFDGKSYTGGYVASNSSFVMDAVPCYPNVSTSTYAAGGVSTGYSISAPAPVNGTSIPRNAILAPWHDINPSPTYSTSTTKIQYLISGTSPNRKAVISWEDVPMFDCESDLTLLHSSQVKIFEYDGHIEIHVKQKRRCAGWNGQDAVLGLHNYNGTIYIPPVNATAHNYPTNWDMTNTAFTFTTPCSNQAGCLTILPITYKEFHGDKIDDVNTLWWNTASEENLSDFIIERSQNGIDFNDIDRVSAKNTPSDYRYKDYGAPEGIINYYRIRSVDVFGKEERTGIVSILGGTNDLLTTWPIYPNPTKKEVYVRLNAKKTGDATFVIYDIVGNKVLEQYEKIETGVTVYGINVDNLKSGIYFIEIQNSLNEPITKQKLIIE